ncbi:sigma factor [Oryzobacter telluris]|uniref:sigma factor n=1 Tax=Oryzobacter telluris TaxID=3149179 RepID=UPI00370DB721
MGDEEVRGDFAAYVRARQHAFVRFAYLLTGDAHEAEDLVQSAFARVYRPTRNALTRCVLGRGCEQVAADLRTASSVEDGSPRYVVVGAR